MTTLIERTPRNHPVREMVTAGRGIMGRVPRAIAAAAKVEEPILIYGETGTGKELTARAIHRLGPRASKLFVPVNCAALAEGVVDSELFGHVRGSFTGAIRDRKGLIRQAEGGTLFLDELNRMTTALQLKLLRAVEHGQEVRPVGEDQAAGTHVRIVSACSKMVKEALRDGDLEWELFWRLGVIQIFLPPLRERKGDLPLLVADIIVHRINPKRHRKVVAVERRALGRLEEQPWPGNIRQLENLLKTTLSSHRKAEVLREQDLRGPLSRMPSPRAGQPTRRGRLLRDVVREARRRAVGEALDAASGDKKEAARMLGISVRTLNRLLAGRVRDKSGPIGSS